MERTLVALLFSVAALGVSSSAGAQVPVLRHSAVAIRHVDDQPTRAGPLDWSVPSALSTARREQLGTYAGVGALAGLVAGAAYGYSRTRHDSFGFGTFWMDAMGGMLAGTLVGAAVYWMREGT